MNDYSYHGYTAKEMSDHLSPIIPVLADLLNAAAARMAEESHGAEVTAFNRDNANEALLFIVADFLMLSAHSHNEDHIYPPLRPHQMTSEHMVAWLQKPEG